MVKIWSITSLTVLLSSSGCRCDDEGETPYTPFGIASSVRTEVPAPSSSPEPSASTEKTFAIQEATALTPPAKQMVLGEWRLNAPEGTLFERVLPWTQAADTPRKALAWLVPESRAKELSPGALHWFNSDGSNRKLFDFPAFVPTAPGCTHAVRLRRTGAQTATVDVQAQCHDVNLAPRLPTRSIRVVAPEQPEPLLLGLKLAPPHDDEVLEVEVQTTDIDGDGHDDVTLELELTTRAATVASAVQVLWLDRAAGAVREYDEPAKSFTNIGSVEVVRAKGKNTSEHVPDRVETARRLMHYLCEGSGVQRITEEKGNGVDCGNLLLARDYFAEALVQAHLTRGLVGEAIFRLESADWYGGISESARTKLAATLTKAVTLKRATSRVLRVRPRDPGPGGQFAPLGFSPDDSLLVQTTSGIQRFADGELSDASDEFDPWPLIPIGPERSSLLGLAYPCEKPLVEVQARTLDGAVGTVTTGRWLSPRPGVCLGSGTLWAPELRPIRWNTEGFSALVGSAWLGPQSAIQAPALGSPVSANGQHWVAPTSLGLFVQHETESELWQLEGLKAPSRQCVIAPSGARVACRTGNDVALIDVQTTSAP